MPGPVCLVCDHSLLIGLDVETCLEGIGVAVAGPFTSGASALEWIATNRPDVAVLDCGLQDGNWRPLISALQEQQVPIIIHSGWSPHEVDMPPEISRLPWVSKPLDCNMLLRVLAEVAPQIFFPESMERTGPIVPPANDGQPIRVKSRGDPLTNVLIKRLKSLAPLSETAAQATADAVVHTYTAKSGQDIVRSAAPQSECHVLLDGMAAAYKLLSEGKRQIVRFAFPGDFLDLEGYICGMMDHSVATLGLCTVGVIPQQALRDLLRDHPDVAMALWRHTLADAAVFREWVVNVRQRSSLERIAHLLCEVYSRLQEIGLAIEISGNRTFSWYVTQQDLADAIGMSIVHVNRSLQELRGRGLVEVNRDKVTIFDWPGLKSLGGFRSDYLAPAQHRRSAINICDVPAPTAAPRQDVGQTSGSTVHDGDRSAAHHGSKGM